MTNPSHLNRLVRDVAASQAETARERTADGIAAASRAADAAASQFAPSSVQAQAASHAAARIDAMARSLRETDIDTMVQTVSDFGRRNPLLFIGASAFAGFAATRFIKARDPSAPVANEMPVDRRTPSDVSARAHAETGAGGFSDETW